MKTYFVPMVVMHIVLKNYQIFPITSITGLILDILFCILIPVIMLCVQFLWLFLPEQPREKGIEMVKEAFKDFEL